MARKKELNETPICEGNPFELFDAAREKFVAISNERRIYKSAVGHLFAVIASGNTEAEDAKRLVAMVRKEIEALDEE